MNTKEARLKIYIKEPKFKDPTSIHVKKNIKDKNKKI